MKKLILILLPLIFTFSCSSSDGGYSNLTEEEIWSTPENDSKHGIISAGGPGIISKNDDGTTTVRFRLTLSNRINETISGKGVYKYITMAGNWYTVEAYYTNVPPKSFKEEEVILRLTDSEMLDPNNRDRRFYFVRYN